MNFEMKLSAAYTDFRTSMESKDVKPQKSTKLVTEQQDEVEDLLFSSSKAQNAIAAKFQGPDQEILKKI